MYYEQASCSFVDYYGWDSTTKRAIHLSWKPVMLPQIITAKEPTRRQALRLSSPVHTDVPLNGIFIIMESRFSSNSTIAKRISLVHHISRYFYVTFRLLLLIVELIYTNCWSHNGWQYVSRSRSSCCLALLLFVISILCALTKKENKQGYLLAL